MSQDIEAIMQAAERLRRVNAGEPYRSVWPDDTLRMIDDQRVVGMFALSILPKGKRPVAVPEGEEWKISVGGLGEFRDNNEANLAIHWDLFDQITDHVANPPPAPSEE